MKVYELINELNRMPYGAEVEVMMESTVDELIENGVCPETCDDYDDSYVITPTIYSIDTDSLLDVDTVYINVKY